MNEGIRPLRVLTWNIHGFVGRDGKRDKKRVGHCISAIAPDIAAFQEVDSRNSETTESDVNHFLRSQVGNHGHEAWALSGPDGKYGQILASRYPLENCRVHDISIARREPRKIMEATVRLPGSSLRVIATHLGLKRGERRYQWGKLYDIVAADLSLPVILLGDLNEWRHRRLPNDLSDLFGANRMPASFPSRLPLFPLDRIYCHPPSWLTNIEIVQKAATASDHLPVLAEIGGAKIR